MVRLLHARKALLWHNSAMDNTSHEVMLAMCVGILGIESGYDPPAVQVVQLEKSRLILKFAML